MPKFNEGDRVQFAKGVFLYQGMFVHGNSVVKVDKVLPAEEGEATYNLTYFDRENIPHPIENIPESELKAV